MFPEDNTISFTIKDKRYCSPIAVTYRVGIFMLTNADDLPLTIVDNQIKVVPTRITLKTFPIVSKIILEMMRCNYPEMDDDWANRNISWPRMTVLTLQYMIPLYKYFKSLNFSNLNSNTEKKKKRAKLIGNTLQR